MKIYLNSKSGTLGEIILNSGSKHTREFRGMLLANDTFFQHRYVLKKYFSDIKTRPTKGLFWALFKLIDKEGKRVVEKINDLNLEIKHEETSLTNEYSEIIIRDTLQKTSKGNWFVQIDVLNMIIPENFPEFELFQVEWLYPAPVGGILGVKKNGELIMKY